MPKVKLKTGKFGTYFESQGTALENEEVLRRLNAYDAVLRTVLPKPKVNEAKLIKIAPTRPARNRIPAYMTKYKPSVALSELIGKGPVVRTEAVAKVWSYIKKHNLQNPRNKRNIIGDEKFIAVTKKKEVTMFELAGIIAKHLDTIPNS